MKIIASDFDNTLYVKDEIDMSKNIDSVKKFIDKGNIFIIITGRSFTNIKKVLNEKKIPYSFLVCQDGANIFDKNDKCLKSNYLNLTKAQILEKYLIDRNIDYSFESAFNDNDTINNAVKITITLSGKEDSKMVLKNIINNTKVKIYAYVSSKHINIIDDYVNKSRALKYLEKEGYIKDEITVIGDDVNDYEMLSNYNGVVMEKHDPTLDSLNKKCIKSVHDYIDKNL